MIQKSSLPEIPQTVSKALTSDMLDPQERGRHFIASYLEKLAGVRMAGFVFTRQAPVGKWGVATYALRKIGDEARHRVHRDHRENGIGDPDFIQPDAPGAPYASSSEAGMGRDGAANTVSNTPMPPMPERAPSREPQTAAGPFGWKARL
jgi:hypothetical protein